MHVYSLLVNAKRAGLSESLAAQVTDKRPLSCVSSDVRFQSSAVRERRGACRTRIWLLASVTPHVTLQAAGVCELFKAVATGVGPLTGMNAHVNVQTAIGAEIFMAVFTLVFLSLSFWKTLIGRVLTRFFLDLCFSGFAAVSVTTFINLGSFQ